MADHWATSIVDISWIYHDSTFARYALDNSAAFLYGDFNTSWHRFSRRFIDAASTEISQAVDLWSIAFVSIEQAAFLSLCHISPFISRARLFIGDGLGDHGARFLEY